MVRLETGDFDTSALEEVQTSVGTSAETLYRLHAACATRFCNASAPIVLRRSCSCRPAKLLNHTRVVQRRLDDAAAGVLFGDSEANMQELSSTMQQHVLHRLVQIGSELERLGRLACGRDAGEGGGGGGRRGERRRQTVQT